MSNGQGLNLNEGGEKFVCNGHKRCSGVHVSSDILINHLQCSPISLGFPQVGEETPAAGNAEVSYLAFNRSTDAVEERGETC